MPKSIRRNLVLREYDIKENPDGSQPVFQLKFIKNNGEIVFLPKAVACGLPYSLSKNSLRGFIPVDEQGKKTGHPYPVSIHAIIEWNGNKVIL